MKQEKEEKEEDDLLIDVVAEAVQDLKEKMIETIETKEMIEAESSKKNLLKKEENF